MTRVRDGYGVRMAEFEAERRMPADAEQVFAVVEAAFAQRRKALRGALRPLLGSADAAERALRAAGVDPMARGEVLGVEQFARIAEAAAVAA